jgi:hypothetical protein
VVNTLRADGVPFLDRLVLDGRSFADVMVSYYQMKPGSFALRRDKKFADRRDRDAVEGSGEGAVLPGGRDWRRRGNTPSWSTKANRTYETGQLLGTRRQPLGIKQLEERGQPAIPGEPRSLMWNEPHPWHT